ncbi:LysE family translocator [Sagittula salina]|nr:LysE family translocator [Sagittula salina]
MMLPTEHSLLAVTLAGLALSATPGPSMLYVLSHSIGQSRAAGLASALGLCLGGVALAVATALGLAALFASAAWVVPVLRLAGAAYLVWLGIGMIREARQAAEAELHAAQVPTAPLGTIVRRGMLVELLNPKTVLFFALFLPPFVSAGPDGDHVAVQLLILGALVPLTAVPSDLAVALMGGSLARRLNGHRGARRAMGWLGGLMLIAIAAALLLEQF